MPYILTLTFSALTILTYCLLWRAHRRTQITWYLASYIVAVATALPLMALIAELLMGAEVNSIQHLAEHALIILMISVPFSLPLGLLGLGVGAINNHIFGPRQSIAGCGEHTTTEELGMASRPNHKIAKRDRIILLVAILISTISWPIYLTIPRGGLRAVPVDQAPEILIRESP